MSRRPDYLYIEDIKERCRDILQATENLTFAEFENNYILATAVCRWFEIIGEASSQMSKESRDRNKQIPWREIIGMRNFLIHAYHNLDLMMVWDAIKNDLPVLLEEMDKFVTI